MPAYNAGAFIADAIESLITQSQGNWQLVIVDDGSSDDTFEVASRYERLDNRIQVLRQENQGPSAARGRGVASASGEWITFLDADDCLEPNAVETFTNCVEKGNNLIYIYSHHDGWKYYSQTIGLEEYRRASLLQEYNTGPWCKLFHRSLFTPNVFDIPSNIRSGEDWIMNIRIAFNLTGTVAFRREIVYVCRNYINPKSLMKTQKGSWEYTNAYFKEFIDSIPLECQSEYAYEIALNLSQAYHSQWRKTWILPKESKNCYIPERLRYYEECQNIRLPVFNHIEYNVTNPLFRMILDYLERMVGLVRRHLITPKHRYFTS